jgi:endonuclease-3|tara:strand:+ start:78 stop:716 length:639 start_codon:yes stop_codon:yes gene_type:complete
MLEDKVRAGKVRKRLRLTYPEVTTQLHYRTSFELLVATILSAQCTDKQVNSVTRGLFKKFNAPKDFTTIPLESLEQLVRATGFFRNKAKNIKACAQALVEKYHGKVPETLEELVLLPGVGRKTANLVLGAAFGIPGIVVDTHVIRISKRLAFTESKDPAKIERDLMKIIPKMAWSDFSLHLVYFGREFCTARKPRCKMCPLIKLCPWPDKNL